MQSTHPSIPLVSKTMVLMTVNVPVEYAQELTKDRPNGQSSGDPQAMRWSRKPLCVPKGSTGKDSLIASHSRRSTTAGDLEIPNLSGMPEKQQLSVTYHDVIYHEGDIT